MKKRTKEIWAGVLVLSILLSTPTSMEAAKTAGRKQAEKGQMAAAHRSQQPHVGGEEETNEETNKETLKNTSEVMSTDTSKILQEELSEEASETISEIFSEELSEVISSEELSEVISSEELSEVIESEAVSSETISSETISSEAFEDISEVASEHISETDSESIPEEITELESDTEEDWVEVPIRYFSPEISDEGEYDYRTYVDQGADLWIKVKKSEAEQDAYDSIKVKNCSLYDSDFYIELSTDEQVQQYAYSEWLEYLGSCKEWVNGKVEVKPSDSGKKYFSLIQMTEQESEGGKGKKIYTIWAENPDYNVSTKEVENGTRSYIIGKDTDAPVLKDLYTDSKYYEPTKTDTEQYFAEDFVLKGTFCDEASGVYRIEYTTDMRANGGIVWTEAEIMQDSEVQEAGNCAVGFQITLSDGCYPAIAVRAYDEAGNVGNVQRFANDTGEQIKVVVDRTAPVLKFELSAEGETYHGENDNWTNKDVLIRVMMDQKSCQYAGIYQYEYVYVKIGENMTDVSEKWEKLSVQDQSTAEFEVTEDKNGYYCFRAVSKSGVETTNVAKQRILIQHEAAELKPIVVSGADEAKCKDGWYNKQSGTPQICFEYPDYDTGVISKEYDAPITIHYNLTKKDSVQEPSDAYTADRNEKSAVIGVMDCSDVTMLKIDVTKPEIDIRFDDTSPVNGNYYHQERVATVHVHELNFDPDQVRVSVTKDGHMIEVSLSDWTSDGSEHYATLAFSEDGVYCITVSCIDLADNASDEVQSELFIIDRTAPGITIALTTEREMQTADQDCFNTGVTAVITVTEHNFRVEDLIINMTSVSEKGVWSHEGDSHTLRIPFKEDNLYHIDCAYTDLAGNAAHTAERDFVIDTTLPMIVIDGVQDGSAISGAVLPMISVFDSNIEILDISVSVMTGIGDPIDIAIQTEDINSEDSTGYRLTLTDMTEKADNVYHLTVSAKDKAGNEAVLTYRFSLNRCGSVYDLISLTQLVKRQYNTYGELEDIQIIEMNIDPVEEFELYVSRNGTLGYEAEYTREVSGSQEVGYTYVYTIAKENFTKEGIYRLTLYSRDRAGNEANNVADIHGEEISFIVDNTAPKVVIDGVESGMVYNVKAQKVHIAVTDNFKLAEAELTLVNNVNEVLESWDYMELAGENEVLEITIPQRSETVSLLYRVKDAAGNEMQTFQGERAALAHFLVTTDKYVQFIDKPSKTPAGRLIIFIMGAAMLSAVFVLFAKVHKKNHKAKDTCN